jgi:uncharacterized membrane protein
MANSTGGMDRLKSVSQDLAKALGDKAMSTAGEKLTGLSDKLEGVADGGPLKQAVAKGGEAAAKGDSPIGGALKGAVSGVKDKITGGGGKGGGSPKATKSTNIVEQIDVGVPIKVAYNQWTEFGGFPSFMKKVENVESPDDNKLQWKAQIFWSHRRWEATVLEQIPDERIVWRSKGEKGHVDGAVTFHELGPNLTRILIVLEYYPQGLMERTGNLWRAQGRRVNVELKHFRRHVMTRTILDPDAVEGWRGTIEDGEVVQTHEEALEEEEQQEQEESEGSEDSDEQAEDEYDDSEESEEPEDEEDSEEEPEDEYDEDSEEEGAEEEPEDEYEESEEEPEAEDEAEEEPEDEYEESEEEPEAEDEAEEEPEDEYEESEEEPEAEEEPEDEYEEDEAEEEPEEEPEDEEEADDEEEQRPSRFRKRRAS